MTLLFLIGLVVALWLAFRANSKKKRRGELLTKYGDPKIVEMILSRSVWQGQTHSQLVDSLGRPLDVDQKVLKSKTKEIWKYNKRGTNRFGLRVTLEDGVVVGWDKKD